MTDGTSDPGERKNDDTEDDPGSEPLDAAADATTADDDEGEIGERNVGGTY